MFWGRRFGVVTAGAAVAALALAGTANASTLQQRMSWAFSGSTATHTAVRADIKGLGTVGWGITSMSPPASNEKLFTAETALDTLDPLHTFTTRVYATAPPQAGVVAGDLVLVPSGDPSLSQANLAELAQRVANEGVTTVTGRVLIDDHLYRHEGAAYGWNADFIGTELGPVDGFSVDENAWRSDATFLAAPQNANGGLWRSALTAAGVHALGHTLTQDVAPPSGLFFIASWSSAPLYKLVAHMLTVSDNYYAESLLDAIGYARGGTDGLGDRSSGLAGIHAEATALRVHVGLLYDGSGLSYADRESPSTLVSWLEAVTNSPVGHYLRAGLPISCRTGTLQHRLCGAWLSARIDAKTGTLTGIATLSGYTTTISGRWVVFSVMVSGAQDVLTADHSIDAAVAQLARLTA